MIITKEHQEAMVRNYAKQGKSKDEVIGFIDGLSEMVNFVTKKSIDELKTSN
tara:strand:+ start:10299 stop:10454 length:156 start_codon:yes stop_codon:yes gene_type:complete